MKRVSGRRRRGAYAACALAIVTVAGCSSVPAASSSGGGTSGSSTVTIAYNTDLVSWNPYGQTDSPDYSRWSNILQPLVGYDYSNDTYTPVLATSWSQSGDNWTFHLRHNVKFQTGTPFTSADVIFSFDQIKNGAGSLQASNLSAIAKMSAPDPYTVVLTTATPDATLLSNLINTFIISKANYEKYGASQAWFHPDGTGPYKFVSWQQGVAMTMVKSSDYWGPEPADMPDKLVFRVITSPEDAVAALQRGEVNIDTNVPPQDKSVVTSAGAKYEAIEGDRTMFFAFNSATPPFNNPLVRQAISYAVNVKGIMAGILAGAATEMNGPVPSNVYGSDPSLKPYPYDPAKAEQMLKQAGAEGDSITLTTTTDRYPDDVQVAQAVQQELDQVGLKVTLATPDFGTFSDELTAGKMAFYQISRGGYVDASDLLIQYFETGVTKRTEYSNPAVDKLLNESNEESNPAKRLTMLHEAEALIMQGAPAVFFGAYTDIYGVTSNVQWQPNVGEDIDGIDMTVTSS